MTQQTGVQRFEGKSVVVTGAAGGIGRSTAAMFAAEGAMVTVADIDADGAQETVEIITASGGTAQAVATDVADSDSVRQMVLAAVDTYGRLDVAHNNAGIMGANLPIDEMPDDTWRRGVDIIALGSLLLHEARDSGNAAG